MSHRLHMLKLCWPRHSACGVCGIETDSTHYDSDLGHVVCDRGPHPCNQLLLSAERALLDAGLSQPAERLP